MFWMADKIKMVEIAKALPGRDQPVRIAPSHYVLGTSMEDPFPAGHERAVFGVGCFWGAERTFWQSPGCCSTAVGYAGGYTPNPTYQEVCSGLTGHAEVVRMIFDPHTICYEDVLRLFWESHDPTQGMRQGNDIGTQYRSGIYWHTEKQRKLAETSRNAFQQELVGAGLGQITTEISRASEFYYAEDYHQQYLAKNPHGYCGVGGTGVPYPAEVVLSD